MAGLFQTVLTMSLGAGLLALLILGARSLLGRRPGPFLPVLYALLMLRLALPLFVPSPLSFQNLLHVPETPLSTVNVPIEEPVITEDQTTTIPEYDLTPPVSQQNNAETASVATDIPESTAFVSVPAPLSAMEIAAIVWLTGIALTAAVFIAGNVRFARMLKRNRAYEETGFAALLDECKQQLGLKRHIPVIQTQGVSAAAVYGVFRPKLLISPDFLWLNPSQRRHVLLHELTHIRRRDTKMCLLAAMLCIVHWFNPLIWLAFGLMRRDIEVFCDDSTVKVLGDDERRSYAATLLTLVSPKKPLHLVTAMFISHTYIKKRILTIARRKKASALYTALALLLTVVIAITGCTAAVADTLPAESPEPFVAASPVPTPTAKTLSTPLVLYSFDFSNYAQDDNRVANIEKIASLLNGTYIEPDKDNHLIYDMKITAENGWKEAPSLTWADYRDVMRSVEWAPALSDTKIHETPQIGGGIDLVLGAIFNAFTEGSIPSVTPAFFEEDFGNGGDLVITSLPDAPRLILNLNVQDNLLLVYIYAAEQSDELPNGTIIGPGETAALLTEFAYQINEGAMENDDIITNIDKAVGLLNGMTVPAGDSVSVTEQLGGLIEQDGWKAAPSTGWLRMQSFATDSSNDDKTAAENEMFEAELRSDTQIGGGIEFAAMALCRASASASLNVRLLQGGQILSGGNLTITNPLKGDIQVTMSRTDGIINVSVFGTVQGDETADQSSALMASYLLDITGHDSDEVVDNVQKAVDLLNGRTIAQGETLSLNAVLGPRTLDSGWKKAAEFQDGAYTASPGGGVCMVATALYNAAIRAEMEVVEIRQHSLPTDYVDGGLDATISTGGPDLKIHNPYNTAVTLDVYLEDNNIIVEVWGPQFDRVVDFYSKKISVTAKPETVYHYNATMTPGGQPIPPGAEIPYVVSCPGAVFRVYKRVSIPDIKTGERVFKEILFSEVTYKAIEGAVYVNGPDPDAG